MTDLDREHLTRADKEIISTIIPQGSRVLDLGCGDCTLLAQLAREKEVVGRGVDIDGHKLVNGMQYGIPVYQGDIDQGLVDFPDNAYDYVILNQTLQVLTKPQTVIGEMLRVGRFGVVGFPNFGYWQMRLGLLIRGRMPKSSALPFDWHDTPNIHQLTIKDFKDFCAREGIRIQREEYLLLGRWRRSPLVYAWANLFALTGLFVFGRNDKD